MEITTLRLVLRRGFVLSVMDMSYMVEREPELQGRNEPAGGEEEEDVPSYVEGVAYIECATSSPLMLQDGALMP